MTVHLDIRRVGLDRREVEVFASEYIKKGVDIIIIRHLPGGEPESEGVTLDRAEAMAIAAAITEIAKGYGGGFK